MTRASLAGVRPRESRTSSARETFTSTSLRATSRSSRAIASATTSRSSPCATTKRSMTSNSAAGRPSMRVTTPFSRTSSGSGSFGPFAATRPSSGKRRDELLEVEIARRARCEAATSHRRGASAPRTPRRLRGRRLRSASRRSSPDGRPMLPARLLSRVVAEAPCTRRASSSSGTAASSAARSKLSASCVRPAARATSACRRNVCGGRADLVAFERAGADRVERHLAERHTAGRGHEVRTPRPEGVVADGVEGHSARL